MNKHKKSNNSRFIALLLLMILLSTVNIACSHKPIYDNNLSILPKTLGNTETDKKSATGNKETTQNISDVNENNKPEESAYNLLKGKVICIDPGHQAKPNFKKEPIAPGSQSMKEMVSAGTSGVETHVPEHLLNLEVSLKLRDLLLKRGAKVIITRQTENVDIGNVERAEIANRANADIVVRIHADGSDNSSVKGISILVPGNKYVHNATLLTKSRFAASNTLKALVESTGAVSLGVVTRNDLTGFNWSTVPVFLVEMGFMTNAHEDRLLNTPEYQEKITAGIVKGLEDYFYNP